MDLHRRMNVALMLLISRNSVHFLWQERQNTKTQFIPLALILTLKQLCGFICFYFGPIKMDNYNKQYVLYFFKTWTKTIPQVKNLILLRFHCLYKPNIQRLFTLLSQNWYILPWLKFAISKLVSRTKQSSMVLLVNVHVFLYRYKKYIEIAVKHKITLKFEFVMINSLIVVV